MDTRTALTQERSVTERFLTDTRNSTHLTTSTTTNEFHQDRFEWQEQQKRYWNGLAGRYDALYNSRWSKLENAWVSRRLEFTRPLVSPQVVDLGCGTGLGYRLLREINPTARYVGIDISKQMLAHTDLSEELVKVGDMDDLSDLEDETCDVVLSLFTSMSFAFRTSDVLAEVARVLRPGGHAYLSLLNSNSPSLTTRRARRDGVYRTRGDHRTGSGAPVRLHNIKQMRKLLSEHGLQTLSVAGMNAMSGSLELPPLWRMGRLAARIFPSLAHTIEFHVRKFG